MGMGKSLSILALAMRTLDDGEEWAQQQNDGAEGKGPLKYSRSTLVVAPSARTPPSFSIPQGTLGLTCQLSPHQQLDGRNQKVGALASQWYHRYQTD